ncbi:MAG: spore coat protein, partial [Candidatus Zixiibacteriota bacterium]
SDYEKMVVILGDNVVEGNIGRAVKDFRKQKEGAKILLKEVPDPQRFGVPEIVDGKIVAIQEKPKTPKSRYAVIGIYMYDGKVFDIIKTLKPSGRGELEITDVSNAYIQEGKMTHDVLEGWWSDAGTFESLLRTSNMVAKGGANKRDL